MILLIPYIPSERERTLCLVTRKKIYPLGGLPERLTRLFPLSLLIPRVVLLGKEYYFAIKKRYPPLPWGDLKRAVSYEIEELVPLREPTFTIYPVRREENFTELFIFAWDRSLTETLSESFRAGYILPEELLFQAEDPTLFIIERAPRIILILSSERRLLGSFITDLPPSPDTVRNFLRGNRVDETTIKRVYFYSCTSGNPTYLPGVLFPVLTRRDSYLPELPRLLRGISLRNYRIRAEKGLSLRPIPARELSFLLLCGLISYEAYLLFSLWEYRQAYLHLSEIAVKNPLQRNETAKRDPRAQLLQEEFEEHALHSAGFVMPLLNELTALLPEDSRITGLKLQQGHLTLSLECGNYSSPLLALRKSPRFSDLRLTRTPALNPQTNRYTLEISIRLKP